MLPYTRAEEFRDRYIDTIIYLAGDPIYVVAIDPREGGVGKVILTYYPLPTTGKTPVYQTIKANSPGLYDTPMNLGYMNGAKTLDKKGQAVETAIYCSRIPIRRSKQGLDAQNIFFSKDGVMNFPAAMGMPTFVQMLKNSYPSWRMCRTELVNNRGKYQSLAFHKVFALSYNSLDLFYLHYKGKPIATSHDGDVYKLETVNQHLKELLLEHGIRAVS